MKHIAQPKWLLILAGLVLHVGVASAQLHIESKIVGKKGEALPLASVYVDADKNTISNMEGEFAIDVDSTDVLRFSYVGYKTVKIPALQVGRKVTLSFADGNGSDTSFSTGRRRSPTTDAPLSSKPSSPACPPCR